MFLEHGCPYTSVLQQKESNQRWSDFDLFTNNFSHQCANLQNSIGKSISILITGSYSRGKRSFGRSNYSQAFPSTIENSFAIPNYLQAFLYSLRSPNDFETIEITIRKSNSQADKISKNIQTIRITLHANYRGSIRRTCSNADGLAHPY